MNDISGNRFSVTTKLTHICEWDRKFIVKNVLREPDFNV